MVNSTLEHLPDSGPEQESLGADLRAPLLRGLSRSLGWVVLATALGTGFGLWAAISQPNLYVSNTKLMLRVGAREQLTSESMVGSDAAPRANAPTMADEMQMLSDSAIFERAARTVGPQLILQPTDPSRLDGPETPLYLRLMHESQRLSLGPPGVDHPCPGEDCSTCLLQASKVISGATTISNEYGSNVINVSFISTSPEKARTITQALADAYIERHREQFSIEDLVEKNRGPLEEAKRSRDAAADAFIAYVKESGTHQTDPLSPTLGTELSELEEKLQDAQYQLAVIKGRKSALADRLKGREPGTILTGPMLMVPNEQYESLLELRRSLVAQQHDVPPSDPARAQDLESRIAEIDRTLTGMPRSVTKAAGFHAVPERSSAPLAGADLALDEDSLVMKIEWLTNRIGEKRAKAEESRKQSLISDQQFKELAAQRDTAEDRYKKMQDRFSQLEALSAIDVNEGVNLRVLQPATLEREKVGPKRTSLLAKGLLAGLLAGLLFGFVRQRFDNKLRYPELFEQSHGLPLLGVVPQLGALRRLPRSPGRKAG